MDISGGVTLGRDEADEVLAACGANVIIREDAPSVSITIGWIQVEIVGTSSDTIDGLLKATIDGLDKVIKRVNDSHESLKDYLTV